MPHEGDHLGQGLAGVRGSRPNNVRARASSFAGAVWWGATTAQEFALQQLYRSSPRIDREIMADDGFALCPSSPSKTV